MKVRYRVGSFSKQMVPCTRCIDGMEQNPAKISERRSVIGLLALGLTGAATVALTVITVPFLMPAVRKFCLPYIPATEQQVRNVITLLKKRQGNVIDLGSGDGRIVIEAARAGYLCCGVELNPWLVLYSKLRASYLGLGALASFRRQDIWKTNLKNYENIIIFGVEEMMPELERKLQKELAPGSSIIACRFPLPNWKCHIKIDSGIDTVWMYEKR